MAKIPVTIIDDDKYKVPTQLWGGQFVVSASSSKQQPDKVYFFDLNNKTYERVSPFNASVDYVEQVTKYEKNLWSIRSQNEKTANLYADPLKNNQMNSFADVFAKSLSWNPLEFVGNMATNTVDLVKTKLVDPILSNELNVSQKSGALFNNLLVNLGETMDYFTGANAVKAVIQTGDPMNAIESFGWDDTYGRKQYDWNIDTNNGVADFAINLGLEIITDPTNWITFGSKAVLKSSIKEGINNILVKSGDDIGLSITKSQADELANVIFKSTVNRGSDALTAIKQSPLARVLNISDGEVLNNLLKKVGDNYSAAGEINNLILLQSITKSMDAMNRIPARLAAATSVLGVGKFATKQMFRGLESAGSYALSKLNRAAKEIGEEVNLANLDVGKQAVYKELTKMSQVTALPKNTPVVAVRNMTAEMQKVAIEQLRNTVYMYRNDGKAMLNGVYDWARNQGYKSIEDAYLKLSHNRELLSDGVEYIYKELFDAINTAQNNLRKSVLEPVAQLLSQTKDYTKDYMERMSVPQLKQLDEVFSSRQILTYLPEEMITPELLNQYQAVSELTHAYYLRNQLSEISNSLHKIQGFAEIMEALEDSNSYKSALAEFRSLAVPFRTVQNIVESLKNDTVFREYLHIDPLMLDSFSSLQRAITDIEFIARIEAKGLKTFVPVAHLNKQLRGVVENVIKTAFSLFEQTNQASKAISSMEEVYRVDVSKFAQTLTEYLDVIERQVTKSDVIRPMDSTAIAKTIDNSAIKTVQSKLREAVKDKPDAANALLYLEPKMGTAIRYDVATIPTDILETFNTVQQVTTELKGIKGFTGVLEHSDLEELLHTWRTEAFNAEIGNATLNILERAKDSFLKDNAGNVNAPIVIGRLEQINYAIDSVNALLDSTQKELYKELQIPVAMMQSHLDVLKMSQAGAVNTILNNEQLMTGLSNIYQGVGIGEVIDQLSKGLEDSRIAVDAERIKSLSESTYIMRKFYSIIDESKMDSAWKSGVYDSLAGMLRQDISNFTVDGLTNTILDKAKAYIDRSNSSQVPLTHMLDGNLSPVGIVDSMRRNSPNWSSVSDVFEANADDKVYDVFFSLGQTDKVRGNIYEFVYATPDGNLVRIINNELSSYVDDLHKSEDFLWSTYGKKKDFALAQLTKERGQYADVPTIACNTTVEFQQAVYDVFYNLRKTASDSFSRVRLVGFDCSGEAKNQVRNLNSFLSNGRLNAKIANAFTENFPSIDYVDLAQNIRIKEYGAVAISESVRNIVKQAVTYAKEYVDEANNYHNIADFAETKMLPDFNNDVLQSMDNMILALEDAINKKSSAILTKEELSLLATRSREELIALLQEFSSFKNAMESELNRISSYNDSIAQTVIVRNVFTYLTKDPNIMHYLTTELVKGEGASQIGLRKLYDPRVFHDWYNTDLVTKGLDTISLQKLNKRYEIVRNLDTLKNKIKRPEVLIDFTQQDFVEVSAALKELSKGYTSSNYLNFVSAMEEMTALDKAQSFTVVQQQLRFVRSHMKNKNLGNDALIDYLRKNTKVSDDVLNILLHPESSIWYTDALYTPGVPVLHSPLLRDGSNLEVIRQEFEVVRKAGKVCDSLKEQLILEDKVRELNGANLLNYRVKEPLLEAYSDFITTLQNEITAIDNIANLSNAETVAGRIDIHKKYSAMVEHLKASLDTMQKTHAQSSVDQVLSLGLDDYTKFLYNTAGVQAIHVGADVFKNANTAQRLYQFVETIKKNPQTGLRVMFGEEPDWLYIYLDKEATDVLSELEKGFEPVKFKAPKYLTEEGSELHFGKLFNRLENYISDSIDSSYHVSMHRILTDKKYDEFYNNLPKKLQGKILDKDFLYQHELFNHFNSTVLGDYNSGVGTLYGTHSGNLISNVTSGVNSIFNNVRGKELYLNLVASDQCSLARRVNNPWGVKVDYKDVQEALKDTGYVVAGKQGDKIVEFVIKNADDLQYALDNNAILIDYNSFDRLRTILNDYSINARWFQIMSKPLLFLKVGLLQSVGWVARNIPDSFIKGMIGNDAGPSYLTSSFMRTLRNIQAYDRQLAEIFEKFKGTSYRDIVAYYADTTIKKELDRTTFFKMFEFYASSASKPTAAQVAMLNNVGDTMFSKVKAKEIVTRTDIDHLLKAYRENGGRYNAVAEELSRVYDNEKLQELLSLFGTIPERIGADARVSRSTKVLEKFMNVNPLMKASNWIETSSRMHAYLYGADYMSGTTSKATRTVERTQFNTTHNSAGKRLMELLLPFSSFQIDNMLFWLETLSKSRGTVLSTINDYMEARYDEEEITVDDLLNNGSLNYLFMNGNFILDETIGSTLKVNDSLSGVLQLITNPLQGLRDMLNIPMDIMLNTINAINADEKAYLKDSYNNTKPLSMYTDRDKIDEYSQLVPVLGAMYLRWSSAYDRTSYSDAVLPMIIPSLFGVVKTDEAGTDRSSFPIGTDWYNRDSYYKSTHRYVYGISYVPSWMLKNPQTYANTIERLKAMGVAHDSAVKMVTEWGYYMKAPDYILKRYDPNASYARGKKYFKPKKTYVRKTYAKKSYPTKKIKKVYAKKTYAKNMERLVTTKRGQRQRVWRPNRNPLYTYGVPNHVMMNTKYTNVSSHRSKMEISRRLYANSKWHRIRLGL